MYPPEPALGRPSVGHGAAFRFMRRVRALNRGGGDGQQHEAEKGIDYEGWPTGNVRISADGAKTEGPSSDVKIRTEVSPAM
jgi:hypothetical protein